MAIYNKLSAAQVGHESSRKWAQWEWGFEVAV